MFNNIKILTLRLSGRFSIIGLVFFVLESFKNCETMDPKALESSLNFNILNVSH